MKQETYNYIKKMFRNRKDFVEEYCNNDLFSRLVRKFADFLEMRGIE